MAVTKKALLELDNGLLREQIRQMKAVLLQLVPPDREDLWDLDAFREQEKLRQQIKDMWKAVSTD